MIGTPQVDEAFHPFGDRLPWLATVAQILDETGIANRKPPEPCPGHVSFVQEYLDFSQQWHRQSPSC
jgi:hypothetical protein